MAHRSNLYHQPSQSSQSSSKPSAGSLLVQNSEEDLRKVFSDKSVDDVQLLIVTYATFIKANQKNLSQILDYLNSSPRQKLVEMTRKYLKDNQWTLGALQSQSENAGVKNLVDLDPALLNEYEKMEYVRDTLTKSIQVAEDAIAILTKIKAEKMTPKPR